MRRPDGMFTVGVHVGAYVHELCEEHHAGLSLPCNEDWQVQPQTEMRQCVQGKRNPLIEALPCCLGHGIESLANGLRGKELMTEWARTIAPVFRNPHFVSKSCA